MSDLKPCPFCGAPTEAMFTDGDAIECGRCGAQGPTVEEGSENELETSTIAAWNRRTPAELTAEQREAVENLLTAGSNIRSTVNQVLGDTDDCGDPGTECPLQNAHKPWHLAGQVETMDKAIAALRTLLPAPQPPDGEE